MKKETEIIYGNDRLIQSLEKIVTAIEEQNQTCQRNLAIQILNAKINAKIAVVLNAMSVVESKEFTELVNQI